jgi:cystathionine beta-lyase/cystathionine gamma-synthase
MLIVADVNRVIEISHKAGSKVIVDNTFATPLLYRPLETGADIVIHSATKYFSGHGNITAGVLCGNDRDLMKSAIEYRKTVGHMLSPDDAYRLNTQIQSFELRFRKQCSNALRLNEVLGKNQHISKIWYPGSQGHSTHAEAVSLFGDRGFGAMITFEFDGKNDHERKSRRDRFIKAVSDDIRLIPSLGDSKTILMPVASVWAVKYPYPGMIRLSVGFESFSGLEKTVTDAIAKAQ